MSTDVYEQQIKAYKEDRRTACQFGLKCYQKNPAHHSRYKHPPKKQQVEEKKVEETKVEEKKVEEKKVEEKKVEEKKVEEKQVEEKKAEQIVTGKKRSNSDREDDDGTSSSDLPQAKLKKEGEISKEAKNHSISPSPSPDQSPKTVDDDTSVESPKKESSVLKDSKTGTENGNTVESSPETSVTGETEKEKKMEVEEESEGPDVPSTDPKKIISDLFLVKMPEDFYKFYEFCTSISSKDPCNALKLLDLSLVGPYDVLNGKITTNQQEEPEKFLRHWRYFYDPPEFQTILKGNDDDGLHYGYWRDDAKDVPIFVAKNNANKDSKIVPVAPNIFGAVASHLEDRRKKATPFEMQPIERLSKQLKAFATEHGISLDKDNSEMREREKMVVARTFHGAGIVVPYNKKTQLGYRDLAATDSHMKKILKKIDEAETDEERRQALTSLEEIVRLATIAADECDFGTCLELGHDLFSSGVERVQRTGLQMLATAYNLLHREKLLKIAQAHSKDRKKGCELGVL